MCILYDKLSVGVKECLENLGFGPSFGQPHTPGFENVGFLKIHL